ncbi:hypothetical protein [Shewanella surugensis]|uniref:Zinc-regulated TonB-dependent outer membrane receptor n=1 Tax=Shewanella surugensis TaxID=212020 RepID=A0ABT0L5R7_9GAMM|nr:hypothetical protein [Shewanella surugensis]MCL1123031.1 hypothetical protein [Shewanella surugensis]
MTFTGLFCSLFSANLWAEAPTLTNPAVSVVLDGYYQNAERPLSEATEGFGLGHTELSLSANIDDLFYGKLTTVFEVNDGETELNVEEAFIQTLAMPAGFSMRGGRFLSDIGYLNNQHVHTDSFADRPAVYRAFLGSHYYDDGVRLTYLAPTDLYWTMGSEIFQGDSLRAEDEHNEREYDNLGVYTIYTKVGGDIGIESSWQAGLSYLHNKNGQLTADEHDHSHDHSSDEHSHDAAYTGQNMYIADVVYKWAPNGNYKYQNLALSGEWIRLTDFAPAEGAYIYPYSSHYQQGWYVSGVYQFTPQWSVGLRHGQVDTMQLDGNAFEDQKLTETDVSLFWHHSHFSTVRLQYTLQKGTNFDGIENDNVVTLQYVMTLGAHGAHQF